MEEGLKLYIAKTLFEIERLADRKVPFHFRGKDYSDAPMGKLIEVFRKLNDNADLHRRLGKYKNERNHVAHKAVAEYYSEANKNPKNRAKLLKRLKVVADEGYSLSDEILEELQNVKLACEMARWEKRNRRS